MVEATKIWNFNQGNWNDGIWGSEDYSDTVKLIYVGKLVAIMNNGTTKVTVTLPFPVYGDSKVSVNSGEIIFKLRSEQ